MNSIPLAFLLFLLASQSLFACSCAPSPPVSEALAGSDFVIYGRCVSFAIVSDRDRVAKIEVARKFKGDGKAKIVKIHAGISESSCGFDFMVGEHYLIYGSITKGVWRTGLCTRTRNLPKSWIVDDGEYSALDMMIGLPREKWKDLDGDPTDPFSSPGKRSEK